MNRKTFKFRDFLIRSKIPITLEDEKHYKRVTIRTKHQGVSLRDEEVGLKIGTKKQFVLKKGQFVLSKIDARYGAFGIAPEEVDGAIITGNFWAYDVDYSKIDIKWFNQFTNSQDFYDICERASSGITHRKYLKEDVFLNFEIELPEPSQQTKIIKRFEQTKSIISEQAEELTHQLSLVQKLRQAFLREAMQGKLVPQDPNDEPASVLLERIKAEKEQLVKEKKIKKQKPLPPISEDEIPFEIPESWVWCRGNSIAKYIDPQPSHRTPPESTDGVPYVAMKDIKNDGSINFLSARKVGLKVLYEHQDRYQLRKGDFIFGKIGTIGKPVRLSEPFNYTLSANVILIQADHSLITSDFLFYFLSSPVAERILLEKKSTMSYPVFGMAKARMMTVPLPALSEQRRIVSKLEELMAFCDELEARIKESLQQNELLLQQVLREALS